MKKNAMLKIAAILLVAVLLTTCAISSTFAKYSTAEVERASNTAQVAKWGITITAEDKTSKPDEFDGDNKVKLFLNAYDEGETPITVQGASNAIVVAPGTENSSEAFEISITGTPEVSYKLIVEANLELEGWADANSAFYCPLVFTVGSTNLSTTGLTDLNEDGKVDAEDFELLVEEAIAKAIIGNTATFADGAYSATFAPNTNAATVGSGEVSVSWAWAFDGDDVKDTALGNAAVDGNPATVQISFSVAAEQVGD